MRPEIWWIIAAAVVILAIVYRLLAWRYMPPLDLPGPAGLPGSSQAGESSSDDATELCQACQGPYGIHCDGLNRNCDCTCGWPENWAEQDDEWADRLHEINQLGKFGDLTRPIAHQTHYEVEYLIRQLGVPEWVPERLRTAA